MKIRPAHHAILCYAEWCADNRRPWPGMKRVAADLARDICDMRTAFTDLARWGLLSTRHHGNGHTIIIRLGDGRETAQFPVHVIHSSHVVPRQRIAA